jgi:toxin ParE1/3/4
VEVKFSGHVEDDLDRIADWIARDNPERSFSFLRELHDAFQRIGRNPMLYSRRPEVAKGARIAVVHSYVILFRVRKRRSGDFVQIERVVYGGRYLPGLLQ